MVHTGRRTGSAVAQYRLAAFYERGWGAAADLERARVWYARAAEQGNVKAMHNLGVLTAAGGKGDLAAAAGWFAKAAEFGLPDSQINLAILHQNGLGLPQDLVQAYKWLAIAARAGDRDAWPHRFGQGPAQPRRAGDRRGAVSVWRARTPDAAANEPRHPSARAVSELARHAMRRCRTPATNIASPDVHLGLPCRHLQFQATWCRSAGGKFVAARRQLPPARSVQQGYAFLGWRA